MAEAGVLDPGCAAGDRVACAWATQALTKACDGSEAFACHMLDHLIEQ